LVPGQNEVRYRVREQLVRLTLPSDAVGATHEVTGMIVINPDGTIVPDESKVRVNLRTLASDDSRRDGFLRRRTLQTDRFPFAEFVPLEVQGLPSPLPESGEVTFRLVGDLTSVTLPGRSYWM
jgi:polyisoprenoid-binding protein YceI